MQKDSEVNLSSTEIALGWMKKYAQRPTSWDEETQEKKDGQLKSIGGKKTTRHVSASYLST